jgi:hypothetical protein
MTISRCYDRSSLGTGPFLLIRLETPAFHFLLPTTPSCLPLGPRSHVLRHI